MKKKKRGKTRHCHFCGKTSPLKKWVQFGEFCPNCGHVYLGE